MMVQQQTRRGYKANENGRYWYCRLFNCSKPTTGLCAHLCMALRADIWSRSAPSGMLWLPCTESLAPEPLCAAIMGMAGCICMCCTCWKCCACGGTGCCGYECGPIMGEHGAVLRWMLRWWHGCWPIVRVASWPLRARCHVRWHGDIPTNVWLRKTRREHCVDDA